MKCLVLVTLLFTIVTAPVPISRRHQIMQFCMKRALSQISEHCPEEIQRHLPHFQNICANEHVRMDHLHHVDFQVMCRKHEKMDAIVLKEHTKNNRINREYVWISENEESEEE